MTPLTAALAAAWLAPAAPVPKGPRPEPLFFPTAVGSRWVYAGYADGAVMTEEVVKAEERKGSGRVLVTVRYLEDVATAPPLMKVLVSREGVWSAEEDGEAVEPPFQVLMLPAKTGASWKAASARTLTTGKLAGVVLSTSATLTVRGEEEVELPFGKVKAVRVEWEDYVLGAGKQGPMTVWYAPGVGMVKRVCQPLGNTIYLKSFTPGKE